MASGGEEAITTQPRTKRKEIETFVRDLDPLQVQGLLPEARHAQSETLYSVSTCSFPEWSEQDVVEKYLKPINMEHLAKPFMENRINGAVLLALEEG